jgi:hypothetical protein
VNFDTSQLIDFKELTQVQYFDPIIIQKNQFSPHEKKTFFMMFRICIISFLELQLIVFCRYYKSAGSSVSKAIILIAFIIMGRARAKAEETFLFYD